MYLTTFRHWCWKFSWQSLKS